MIFEWLLAHRVEKGANDNLDFCSWPNYRQICLATGVSHDDVIGILEDLKGLGATTLRRSTLPTANKADGTGKTVGHKRVPSSTKSRLVPTSVPRSLTAYANDNPPPEALPSAKFEGDGFILHQGDSLEVMRTMPSASVDLVFTSPPYNLGFTKNGGSKYSGTN